MAEKCRTSQNNDVRHKLFAVSFSHKTVPDALHNNVSCLNSVSLGKRLNVFEHVINAEILVFYLAHIVVRKNIKCLYRLKSRNEHAKLVEPVVILSDAGNNNVTNPELLFLIACIFCKSKDIFVALTRKLFVLIVVNMLDVKHYNIGNVHKPVNSGSIVGIKSDTRSIETGVNAPLLSLFKKFGKESELSHRLSACASQSAVLEKFLNAVIHIQNLFRRNFSAETVCIGVELPCVRIVAVLASHRTSLEKDDEPDTGSVDCSERFS